MCAGYSQATAHFCQLLPTHPCPPAIDFFVITEQQAQGPAVAEVSGAATQLGSQLEAVASVLQRGGEQGRAGSATLHELHAALEQQRGMFQQVSGCDWWGGWGWGPPQKKSPKYWAHERGILKPMGVCGILCPCM